MKFTHDNSMGFTLLELLSVLMLVAVVGLFLLYRGFADSSALIAETEIAKTHFRFIQHLALSNDLYRWELVFDESSYTLKKNDADVMLPNEDGARHEFSGDIILTVTRSDGGEVNSIGFNSWGAPEDGEEYHIRLFHPSTFQTSEIIITQQTGFVR